MPMRNTLPSVHSLSKNYNLFSRAHQLHDGCDDEGVLEPHGGDEHPARAIIRVNQYLHTCKRFMATSTSAAHWRSVQS